MDTAGPSVRQNSLDLPMPVADDGCTNLDTLCNDDPIHDPACTDQDRPPRFYTTSSQLGGELTNSMEELSGTRETGEHLPPRTRSTSNATEAFVNHHQLLAALFQTNEAFSAEAEGSGFVIAPDLRSVNVGHTTPSVFPPTNRPRAANDPLAYLDGIFTSLGSGSNNGPLLNRYYLPEPN